VSAGAMAAAAATTVRNIQRTPLTGFPQRSLGRNVSEKKGGVFRNDLKILKNYQARVV
jgi:hypothetical protein